MLSFIAADAAQAASITIPGTYQAGDLLVIFAFRDGSTTAPSLPAGWTSVGINTGTTCSSIVGFKVATSGSETSGTWTNANGIVCHVYRGQSTGSQPVVNSAGNAGSTSAVDYPGIGTMNDAGNSWVIRFAGNTSTDTALETPPSGHTNRANNTGATCEVSGHDTNGAVASSSFGSVAAGGTAGNWITKTLELIADRSPSGVAAKAAAATSRTTTGTQLYSGVGHPPKALIMMGDGRTATGSGAHAHLQIGFGSLLLEEASAGWNAADAVGTTDTVRSWRNNRIMNNNTQGSTTTNLAADLSAIGTGGALNDDFTLNYSVAPGVAHLLPYLSLGGTDIEKSKIIVNQPLNTVAGQQTITGVGFKADVVFAIMNLNTATGDSNNNSVFAFGVAKSASERWSMAVGMQNAATVGDNRRVLHDDLFLVQTQVAADNYETKVDFVEFNNDGCVIDLIDEPGAAYAVAYLFIKGGRWAVGTDTQKTSTGTKLTSLPFSPKAVILGSAGYETANTITPTSRMSFGFGTGSSEQQAMWAGDEDAADPTKADSRYANNKVLMLYDEAGGGAPTALAEAAIADLIGGINLDWTTADGTARIFGYAAVGNVSRGFPFHIRRLSNVLLRR